LGGKEQGDEPRGELRGIVEQQRAREGLGEGHVASLEVRAAELRYNTSERRFQRATERVEPAVHPKIARADGQRGEEPLREEALARTRATM